MTRAKWEVLLDVSGGSGFTTATTETNSPARVAGQYTNFTSCPLRAVDASRVRVGKAQFLASTSVFGFVFAIDFDGDHTVANDRTLLDITEDASNWIRVYFRASDDKFVFEVRKGGTTESVATAAQTWTAGQGIVLVVYATASALGIAVSINRAAIAAFTTAARAQTAPTLADTTIDLGRREDGTLYAEGAFAYVAALNAQPSVADATAFAEAQRPPLFGEHVGRAMTALWYGRDTAYLDDARDIVTPEVRELHHELGRDYPSTRSGRATAGKCTLRLNNVDGRYSPSNTASPLTGLLLPRRRLRVRAADATQHYARWYGFLSASPKPSYAGGFNYEATVEADGAFSMLQSTTVKVAAATNVLTGNRVGAVLDAAGWPSADRDIDGGQETMTVHDAEGRNGEGMDSLTALRELEETEGPGAWIHESNDGQIVFVDRHRRLTAARCTTSQVTLDDDPGGAHPIADLQEIDPLLEIFNDIQIAVHPVGAAAGVATLWTLSSSANPTIGVGETLTITAEWPGPSSTTGAYVETWTTPDATDVTVTGVAFGDLGIAVTKRARSMAIAITNNGAAIATITALRARGTAVSFADALTTPAVDAASQAKYGVRSWPVSPRWLSNVLTARDHAAADLARYKDPVPLYRAALLPERSDAHMAACLALELDDLITLDADQVQYGVVLEDCFVERVVESVAYGPGHIGHELKIELSSGNGDAHWWALGVSTLGVGTVLAY